MTPAEFCERYQACREVATWAMTQPTMAAVWGACPRPDWLLWILRQLKREPDARTSRRFAVWCCTMTPLADGRSVYALMTDPRSRRAIEVAERWCYGGATDEELVAARTAAAYAAAADAAAAYAAYAAAYAAAAYAARTKAHQAQADALRALVPNPFLRGDTP